MGHFKDQFLKFVGEYIKNVGNWTLLYVNEKSQKSET